MLLVSDLDFSYTDAVTRATVPVLRGFNLTVPEGEFLSLVGPSGCGKSTLIHVVAGLLRYESGVVQIGQTQVHGPSKLCGLVFQQASLLPWRTALQNVAWAVKLRGFPSREIEARALDAIRAVGLEQAKDRYPGQLSGGMQQRVNLARALAVNPMVLLADEPFASLDAQTREIMQRHLLDVWSQHRKTIVFVTHQIEEALFLADRVAVMLSDGRVKEFIAVPFSRPRSLDLKRDARFLALAQAIWNMLEEDVLRSAGLAGWGPRASAMAK